MSISENPCHGCCWETFYIFAYCGLVGNPHLTAKIFFLLPFQRQPRCWVPFSVANQKRGHHQRKGAKSSPEHQGENGKVRDDNARIGDYCHPLRSSVRALWTNDRLHIRSDRSKKSTRAQNSPIGTWPEQKKARGNFCGLEVGTFHMAISLYVICFAGLRLLLLVRLLLLCGCYAGEIVAALWLLC